MNRYECPTCGYIESDEGAEEIFTCDCKTKININLDEVVRELSPELDKLKVSRKGDRNLEEVEKGE
jgi:hypothetical protein